MSDHQQPKKDSMQRLKTLLSVVTLVALFGFIYALRDQIIATFQNLQQVNLWAIALMPLLQLVNYHAYTRMYQSMYQVLGHKLPYKKLYRVQLELNFVNNVFPSGGVSGISYFGLRMRDFGIGAGKSTLVQVMKFALLFISFQIMLGIGLLILAIGGKSNNLLILVATSLASFMLMGTLLMGYILSSRERVNTFFAYIVRGLNRLIYVFRPKHPETIRADKVRRLLNELHESYMLLKSDLKQLKKPLLCGLLANTTEILTVYAVYMAFNEFINLGAVIIAYAVSNFAGTVSVLPGGLGVYEALMTATLVAAGIPAALSLPVTVMYRILNSSIQLPVGAYFYYKTLHRRQSEQV